MKFITNSNLNPIYKNSRPGELKRNLLNINKAKQLLNWIPKYNLDNGLVETINWFKENN